MNTSSSKEKVGEDQATPETASRFNEAGLNTAEYALIAAILVALMTGAILYLQRSANTRIETGRQLYDSYELPDPN